MNTDDAARERAATHLAAKRALELEKLKAEVDLAKSQVTVLGNFARLLWPVITSAITVGVSLAALIVSLVTSSRQARLQYALDNQRLIAANLETATNDAAGAARRVTSIWTLSSFWSEEQHEVLLAETLSALLSVGGDKNIGLAAADVLGVAITEQMDGPTKARRTALLYGDRRTWTVGTVIRQQKFLIGSDTRPCTVEDNRDDRVEATRQAIRKNWESLRYAHLRGADLAGARLAGADMTGAYLFEAKLNHADLQGARVDGTDFTGSCVEGANVKNLIGTPQRPNDFRSWLLNNGAVDMTESQFDLWRLKGFAPPLDWKAWRSAGFPLDDQGRPR